MVNPVNLFTTKYIIFSNTGNVKEYVAILYKALYFNLYPEILVTIYAKTASNNISIKILEK